MVNSDSAFTRTARYHADIIYLVDDCGSYPPTGACLFGGYDLMVRFAFELDV